MNKQNPNNVQHSPIPQANNQGQGLHRQVNSQTTIKKMPQTQGLTALRNNLQSKAQVLQSMNNLPKDHIDWQYPEKQTQTKEHIKTNSEDMIPTANLLKTQDEGIILATKDKEIDIVANNTPAQARLENAVSPITSNQSIIEQEQYIGAEQSIHLVNQNDIQETVNLKQEVNLTHNQLNTVKNQTNVMKKEQENNQTSGLELIDEVINKRNATQEKEQNVQNNIEQQIKTIAKSATATPYNTQNHIEFKNKPSNQNNVVNNVHDNAFEQSVREMFNNIEQKQENNAIATLQTNHSSEPAPTIEEPTSIVEENNDYPELPDVMEENSVEQNIENHQDDATINPVVVVGHTDKSGTDSYNQELSESRAKEIANYLIANGTSTNELHDVDSAESEQVENHQEDTTNNNLVVAGHTDQSGADSYNQALLESEPIKDSDNSDISEKLSFSDLRQFNLTSENVSENTGDTETEVEDENLNNMIEVNCIDALSFHSKTPYYIDENGNQQPVKKCTILFSQIPADGLSFIEVQRTNLMQYPFKQATAPTVEYGLQGGGSYFEYVLEADSFNILIPTEATFGIDPNSNQLYQCIEMYGLDNLCGFFNVNIYIKETGKRLSQLLHEEGDEVINKVQNGEYTLDYKADMNSPDFFQYKLPYDPINYNDKVINGYSSLSTVIINDIHYLKIVIKRIN